MRELDLDPESRRVLNLDGLLQWIAEAARTAPGARRLRELTPRSDAVWIESQLETIEEIRRRLRREGPFLPHALPDPRPHLDALTVAGANLEAGSLRELAVVVHEAGALGSQLRALDDTELPRLCALGEQMPDLRRSVADVLRHVDGEGRIADDASDELRRIRREHGRVGRRLVGLREGGGDVCSKATCAGRMPG